MTIKPLYMLLAAGALGAALVPVVRRKVRNRREAAASNGADRAKSNTSDRYQASSAQRPAHAGAAGD